MTASDDDLIRRWDALEAFMGYDRIGDIKDAISALPAVQVTVKPLEWVDREDGGSFADTWHIWCEVFKVDRGFIATHCAVEVGIYDTLEAAKAEAQADYEARIRSALTSQPSPDVAALTEAEIAQIEAGGKRWHGEAAQSYRWEPYKPDGQRQMKAKGRWQRQVGSGDYWRWENCDRPAALARLKGGAA